VGTAQATGGSGSDTLTSIENLIGSAYADRLTGNTGANSLGGGAGSIRSMAVPGVTPWRVATAATPTSSATPAMSSAKPMPCSPPAATTPSTVICNLHPDRQRRKRCASWRPARQPHRQRAEQHLYAGAGNNVLDGATGNDTVSYAYGLAGTSGVTVNLAVAGAQATGGSGSDTLISIENLIGSAYATTSPATPVPTASTAAPGRISLMAAPAPTPCSGGDGSDTYSSDDAGDVVSETNAVLATGGNDIVYSYLAPTP
jgi:serralysin